MADQSNPEKKADIVIVDDEYSIVKEMKILLGRTYKIHAFTNPGEAEKFIDENPVEMIIADELMPEMRGSVLLSRIHRKYPDICNIVLSGQAEKDDIVRAVNEGHLFSFLYKPVEKQQLINVIEKGLENRNMKIRLAEQNKQLKEYSENLEKMVEEKKTELVKAYDRLDSLDTNKKSFLIYLSQEMDSSLDRIHKLADVLLSYFAFAGDKIEVNHQAVNLKNCVDEILADFTDRIKDSGLTLETGVDDGATVTADPVHLTRVIRIVVDNALIYTREGTIRIFSSTAEGRIQLCTADTGEGIDRDNLKKVFKPFSLDRGHRHPNGFGLNLPMANTIMNAMEGIIWAESDGPGKGATFCLELRAAA